jgi:hypothetical protein
LRAAAGQASTSQALSSRNNGDGDGDELSSGGSDSIRASFRVVTSASCIDCDILMALSVMCRPRFTAYAGSSPGVTFLHNLSRGTCVRVGSNSCMRKKPRSARVKKKNKPQIVYKRRNKTAVRTWSTVPRLRPRKVHLVARHTRADGDTRVTLKFRDCASVRNSCNQQNSIHPDGGPHPIPRSCPARRPRGSAVRSSPS